MPQGAQRGTEMDLRDRSYDGYEEGGQLTGGLGQLVDGLRGYDSFRMDLEASPKGGLLGVYLRISDVGPNWLLIGTYKTFCVFCSSDQIW